MVKSVITIICACVIIIVGAVFESVLLKRNFNELNQSFTVLYQKVENRTATQDDVLAVQKSWLDKKKTLHAFIPHTEIKEMDLWIAESVTLVRDEEWADAVSKIEVLIELTEQIPELYRLKFGNIF